jgi:hypothetical protein
MQHHIGAAQSPHSFYRQQVGVSWSPADEVDFSLPFPELIAEQKGPLSVVGLKPGKHTRQVKVGLPPHL